MSSLTVHQITYLTRYYPRLTNKKIVWDVFGQVENRPTLEVSVKQFQTLQTEYKITRASFVTFPTGVNDPGDVMLVKANDQTCIGFYNGDNEVHFLSNTVDRPIDWRDTFLLKAGMIPNFTSTTPIQTSAGIYLLNAIVLVAAFGDVIPYVSGSWSPSKLQSLVATALREDRVTPQQVTKYADYCFHLGGLSMLCVVTATEKSFITDPNIIKRRNELVKEHAGQLTDPTVGSAIEDELTAMDREFLGDDESLRFIQAMGSKALKLHRKKMLITGGTTEEFTEGAGEFGFIQNSLAEGWNPKDFALIQNDSRKGSYSRGYATQLGGALTKFMLRIFQNVEIREPDCKTHKGMTVTLTTENRDVYYGRTVYVNNEPVVLKGDTAASMVGKTVVMRSPMYCKTPDGFCATCCGEMYAKLDQKAIAMLTVQITSTFLTASMKAMHGKTVDTIEVDPLDFMMSE